MSPDGAPDLAAARRLLEAAFTADDLRRFCQDRPVFRFLLLHFGPGFSFAQMIDVVLEQCQTQALLPELLAAVREANPRQYERYQADRADTLTPGTRRIVHNLPPRDEFVGRELDKARVYEGLASRLSLIGIDGMGGIGKSALAREVAHECLAASREPAPAGPAPTFSGFVWVSATDRDLTVSALLDAIAVTLDHDGIVEQPPERKRLAVERLLRDRPCLLIVDNLESVADQETMKEIMAFLLRLPERSKALLTARTLYLSQVWVVSLAGLAEGESLELIRREGRRLQLQSVEQADATILGRLHDATGGAPQAIIWAVAQIKQRGRPLDQVVRELPRARAPFFDDIFAGFWSLLSPEAGQVLMTMPLFVTSATRADLEATADLHDDALDAAIGQLVETSLLNARGELDALQLRYTVHPLTRAYVLDRIRSLGAQAFVQVALDRLLNRYAGLVAPPQEILMGDPYWDGLCNYGAADRLRIEWDNLVYLIRWALDAGAGRAPQGAGVDSVVAWPAARDPDDAALKLFLPLIHLMNGWGMWAERLQLSEAMCAAAHRRQDAAEAWLWIDAIGHILRQQQPGACLPALERGRAAARRHDVVEALVLADATEAWTCVDLGQIEVAKQRLGSAQALLETGPPGKAGRKVRDIARVRVLDAAHWVSQAEGDHDRARELLEEAIRLRESLHEYTVPMLGRLAYLHLRARDWEKAGAYIRQALQQGLRLKDRVWMNFAQAQVAAGKGDLQTARALGERALQQFRDLGSESRVRQCEVFLASLAEHNRDRERPRQEE